MSPIFAVQEDDHRGYVLLWQMPSGTRLPLGSLRTTADLTRRIVQALNESPLFDDLDRATPSSEEGRPR